MTDPNASLPPEDESFGAEVKALLGGLGWGVRWLIASLVWGLSLFTFVVLIVYALWGGPIERPGPYYGLIMVTGLLTVIFSVVRRQLR